VIDLQQHIDSVPEALRPALVHRLDSYSEALAEAGEILPAHGETLGYLCRIFAASDFVAEQCIRQPGLLPELQHSGDLYLAYAEDDHMLRLHAWLQGVAQQGELQQRLRAFRQREMVRIAWRDIAGWNDLQQTLHELSWLAEACVDGALYHLYNWACQEQGTPCSEDGTPQRLVVIGMGKLGARELNFSSDIDLMFTYPEDGETRGKRPRMSNEEFFLRLGQQLVQVLDNNTAEGFVFRTDMRLRPFGDSGPLAASFDVMEEYYLVHGREWERYALIKARVIAGDRERGAELMHALRPFVYRRYLDFGAFESLRDMKQRIAREVKRKGLEQNIKLGAGGIREIEFIGQAFQLIRGGRETALQVRDIRSVLKLLADKQCLPGYAVQELLRAYDLLRRVENRLQQVADRQTHRLPEDKIARQRLAYALGYAREESLFNDIAATRHKVHEHFEQLVAVPQTEQTAEDALDLAGIWQGSVEAAPLLQQLKYDDVEDAARHLHALHDSHAYRALSAQGKGRLDQLMPLVIGACAETDVPSRTLQRVLQIIETIARRSVYLVLLAENPMALSQLVRLCAASPMLTEFIAEHPLLLDELLDPRRLYTPLGKEQLQQELHDQLDTTGSEDLEQQMEVLRHFRQTNTLRVAAADVSASLPLMKVSDYLTDIAEVILAQVLDLVWRHLVTRHGRPRCDTRHGVCDTGFAIVAYGKLGGIELGYGSDLDLVFVYSGEDGAHTAGPQVVPIEVFYARLGQRMIHMLNTMTPSGVLYEVDMRLRPSGASGLLVTRIDSLTDYQRNEAWTWEHQAMVRARVVAGDPLIGEQFKALRREILCRARDADSLRQEVADMRSRMRQEHASKKSSIFHLKNDPGGMTDIEFMVQYAVLRWSAQYPALTDWTDDVRILETLAGCGLLSGADAQFLADAYRTLRAQVHRLSLQDQPATVAADSFRDMREQVQQLWQQLIVEDSYQP
jgi:glutamate-ammonia-ligase adenylyltransferase